MRELQSGDEYRRKQKERVEKHRKKMKADGYKTFSVFLHKDNIDLVSQLKKDQSFDTREEVVEHIFTVFKAVTNNEDKTLSMFDETGNNIIKQEEINVACDDTIVENNSKNVYDGRDDLAVKKVKDKDITCNGTTNSNKSKGKGKGIQTKIADTAVKKVKGKSITCNDKHRKKEGKEIQTEKADVAVKKSKSKDITCDKTIESNKDNQTKKENTAVKKVKDKPKSKIKPDKKHVESIEEYALKNNKLPRWNKKKKITKEIQDEYLMAASKLYPPGYSKRFYKIADELNQVGVLTLRGHKWNNKRASDNLRNLLKKQKQKQ